MNIYIPLDISELPFNYLFPGIDERTNRGESPVKVSVFVGVSLDGYLARRDGTFDFLKASGAEQDNGYDAFIATVDALIIGRNTYEVVRSFPTWPYGKRTVVVLSTRPLGALPTGALVERLSGEPCEVLASVAARGFRHAYLDGGVAVQSFLRAGLVDRVVITRVPVLIGAGIPLFGPVNADISLRHLSTRVLSRGAVQSEYALRLPL